MVPVNDLDGSYLWDEAPSGAEDLVTRGHAKKFYSGRYAIGVKLLIALADSPRADDIRPTDTSQSALSPASYGKRYTFEEHIAERFYIHQFSGFNRNLFAVKDNKSLDAGKVCLLSRKDFLRVVASIAAKS